MERFSPKSGIMFRSLGKSSLGRSSLTRGRAWLIPLKRLLQSEEHSPRPRIRQHFHTSIASRSHSCSLQDKPDCFRKEHQSRCVSRLSPKWRTYVTRILLFQSLIFELVLSVSLQNTLVFKVTYSWITLAYQRSTDIIVIVRIFRVFIRSKMVYVCCFWEFTSCSCKRANDKENMETLTSWKNNNYETKSYHQLVPQYFDVLKQVPDFQQNTCKSQLLVKVEAFL